MIYILALALCAPLFANADGTDGYLLASKELVPSGDFVVVAGRDLTIKYTLVNVGDSEVTAVSLNDESVSSGPFEIKEGKTSVTFAKIAPGKNVTHEIIVRPLVAAGDAHLFGGAHLTYKASEDSDDIQKASTSAPGNIVVTSYEEYARATSQHITEWITFALLCLVPVGIPYHKLTSSQAQYAAKKTE